MSMRVPACYRSFGVNTRAKDDASNDKKTFKNVVSFQEKESTSQMQKEYRKYKAPCLSAKG